MVKIAQFGEGCFLRSFVDLYFQTLNAEGGEYSVSIMKPRKAGSLEVFAEQNNRYSVVLRGLVDGEPIERVCPVESVSEVFSPFMYPERFYALARDPELKLIISNTTESGICFNADDPSYGFADITFPAKLTKFLLERYRAGLPGVYLLPCELIDSNADELLRCVKGYCELWELPDGFTDWLENECFWCNTLVDRIVSGFPRDDTTREHIHELIGRRDKLASVAEPFGLWAVENKGDIASYIKSGRHNIDVILTDDIGFYKKRKVRVLNGSHTNLVAAGLMLGAETVADCMENERLHSFFADALEEIIPFVSDDIAATRAFAEDVEMRFKNPFLNHRLESIALNSISKWRARDLPSFADYYEKLGRLPEALTVGFAYLMALYSTRTSELRDDPEVLADFAAHRPIADIMGDVRYWGEELTRYEGFADRVLELVERIKAGEVVI